MKKYITLFTFVCVLFLGMQTATAQNTAAIKAKAQTQELTKSLQLTDAQVESVYAIYLAYEKSDKDVKDLGKLGTEVNAVLRPEQQLRFNKKFTPELDKQKKYARAKELKAKG